MICHCETNNSNRILTFPQFRALTPEMFECIKKYVQTAQKAQEHGIPISDLSLANIFMWNHYYNFQISKLDDFLIILSENSHQLNFYYPPLGPGNVKQAIIKILNKSNELSYFQNQKPVFRRVYQGIVDQFLISDNYYEQKNDDGEISYIFPHFKIEPEIEHYDYVYLTEDLVNISGRKYAKKRNHIKNFEKLYTYNYKKMVCDDVEQIARIYEQWFSNKDGENSTGLIGEKQAIDFVFANYKKFDLVCGGIAIDDKIEAFCIAERINPKIIVVKIEKANPNIPYLYSVLNNQFAKNQAENCIYINREQDLGLPGLRQSKRSYNPHHMEKKYKIIPIP